MKKLLILLAFIPVFAFSQSDELMNCQSFGDIDEVQLEQFKRSDFDLQKSLDDCHTYPITFFVMHVGEPVGEGLNISDNQIYSSIESLNTYWHNDSIYEVDTAAAFPHTFTLDTIIRVNMQEYFSQYQFGGINTSQSSTSSSSVSVGQIWDLVDDLGIDRDTEFVLYSYNHLGGILGFAWLGNISNGCWVRFNHIGDRNWEEDGEQFIGNPNNLTTVHEMGHIFGLRHTFDFTNNDCTPVQTDDNCGNINDRVCDTPVQTVTYGCAPSCGHNPRNHMGYRFCRNQFTAGQRDRALLVEANPFNDFDDYKDCNVEGCTDESACNYNSDATVDDGSCVFNGDTCIINEDLGITTDCDCEIISPYVSSFSSGECTDSLRFYFKSIYDYNIDSMIVQVDDDYYDWPPSYDTTFTFIPEEPFDTVALNWITLPQSNNVYLATVSYTMNGDTTWVDDAKFYCPAPPDTPGCGIILENGQYSLPDNAFYFAIYLLEAGAPDIELIEGFASNYPGALDLPELEIGQYLYFKILYNDGTQCTYYTAISE